MFISSKHLCLNFRIWFTYFERFVQGFFVVVALGFLIGVFFFLSVVRKNVSDM